MKKKSCAKLIIISFVFFLKNINVFAQSTSTNYFRSAQSGAWDAAATWETSVDGVSNWTISAISPTADANTITIRNGHTVTITNSASADQLVIEGGGVLNFGAASTATFTVNDGVGSDIVINSGGTFRHNTSVLPSFLGSSMLEVQTGGVVEVTNGTNAHSYANTASATSSHVSWADSSIFNWNATTSPTNSITYFPANTAIPVFKVSKNVSIGGSAQTIINGILQANATVSLQSSGSKTFRNGIVGTGKVGVTAANSGQIIISGVTARLGGAESLDIGSNGLSIGSGTTLTLVSDKIINNYNTLTTVSYKGILITGILIAGNYTVSGNSKIQIDGTIKTTNSNGLTGATNTTFASGFGVNISATTSTVEYNREGDQSVTPLTYFNLFVTASGSKTVSAGADIIVAGTLNISSGNTFILNGVNDLKLNGGGTLNINLNATFDSGGESQIGGGGTPTINIYGRFVTRDVDGFTGANTSIPGATSTPTTKLNIYSGSTVEYARGGDQLVTARNDYKNLTFSNSGVKTLPTCNPAGTVLIKDNAIADASSKTFGDANTNLTMTGGRFRVGSNGTKPDIAGSYFLTGGVVEFTNSGATTQTIRATVPYYNIEISGTNVANSLGNTAIADQGTFTVKKGGIFENTAFRIDGTTGIQTFIIEAGGIFKTGTTGGFLGDNSAALKGFETLTIDPKATIVYSRFGDQTITPLSAYPTLLLKGSGNKAVAAGTITIAATADSMVIDPNVVFKINAGAMADFNNRPVFVKSTAAGTGMIGVIADGPSALLNATKVTVERYIPARRAFRLLSPAVNTTTSVKANWMEGVNNTSTYSTDNLNPLLGFGTHITGKGGSANGFDPTITNNPSFFNYDNGAQNWGAMQTTGMLLKAGNGYRLLVRGSRSTDLTTNTPTPTPTVLRSIGTLISGTITFDKTNNSPVALSILNAGFSFIGNPYASPVDWEALVNVDPSTKQVTGTAKDITPTYWTWDPNINTRGGYVYYNAVTRSNNISLSKVNQYIQPGQAFFIQTTGANPNPTLQFKETAKATATTNVFRTYSDIPKISIQLLLKNDTASEDVADGVVAFFGDNFSPTIENEDSRKIDNLDENLSIVNAGAELSMEGRPLIFSEDSLPLKIRQLKQSKYFLRIEAVNMPSDLSAFVKDAYLSKEVPVDLSAVAVLPFSITSDPASFAARRFTLLFKSNRVLAADPFELNAYAKADSIEINWSLALENNVTGYEIQKSVDGSQFSKVANVPVKNANVVINKYSWTDVNANPGNNFYRIKTLVSSGKERVSNIVRVKLNNLKSYLSIFPNPVTDNTVNVTINNRDKGRYTFELFNNLSEKVASTTIFYGGGSSSYQIKPGRKLAKGVYLLRMIAESATTNKTIIIK